MSTQRFDFQGAGGQALSGRMEAPEGPARAYALFAHCFTCSKDGTAARRIARALAARGVAVLRFDFTGLGDSEGEFGATGLAGDVDDLVAAAEAMAAAGMAPSLMVGHSLGGTAVLAAASRLPAIKALAVIGSPFDAAHVTSQFGAALPVLQQEGEAEVSLGGRPFRLKRSFLAGLADPDHASRIGHLHKALLILHAPRDPVVGIENAEAIFRAARHPKSFVSLDGADHLLTQAADAQYAAGVIAAWAERYLPAPTPSQAADPAVVAESAGEGAFQTVLSIGGQRLLVDEPLEAGGDGKGPSPYGLISGALAACTAMTLRLYARRKGWPEPRVRVETTHAKSPGKTPPDTFTRRIALLDDPGDERRALLMAAAERCPVHKTLEGGVAIVTEDVDRPRPMPPPEAPDAHLTAMTRACDEG